ncbi:MAG: hypothetical protein WCO30_00395, partial [bacterium]
MNNFSPEQPIVDLTQAERQRFATLPLDQQTENIRIKIAEAQTKLEATRATFEEARQNGNIEEAKRQHAEIIAIIKDLQEMEGERVEKEKMEFFEKTKSVTKEAIILESSILEQLKGKAKKIARILSLVSFLSATDVLSEAHGQEIIPSNQTEQLQNNEVSYPIGHEPKKEVEHHKMPYDIKKPTEIAINNIALATTSKAADFDRAFAYDGMAQEYSRKTYSVYGHGGGSPNNFEIMFGDGKSLNDIFKENIELFENAPDEYDLNVFACNPNGGAYYTIKKTFDELGIKKHPDNIYVSLPFTYSLGPSVLPRVNFDSGLLIKDPDNFSRAVFQLHGSFSYYKLEDVPVIPKREEITELKSTPVPKISENMTEKELADLGYVGKYAKDNYEANMSSYFSSARAERENIKERNEHYKEYNSAIDYLDHITNQLNKYGPEMITDQQLKELGYSNKESYLKAVDMQRSNLIKTIFEIEGINAEIDIDFKTRLSIITALISPNLARNYASLANVAANLLPTEKGREEMRKKASIISDNARMIYEYAQLRRSMAPEQ